jgi:hypothetical protein
MPAHLTATSTLSEGSPGKFIITVRKFHEFLEQRRLYRRLTSLPTPSFLDAFLLHRCTLHRIQIYGIDTYPAKLTDYTGSELVLPQYTGQYSVKNVSATAIDQGILLR